MRTAGQLLGAACLFSAATALSCGGGGSASSSDPVVPAQCTFTNPVAVGADPWVVRQDGMYYFIQSRNDGIWISKSSKLTDVVVAAPTQIWSAPATGWNHTNIWAPELHYIDGRWYVYYAGGESGPPYLTQHAGVLQSAGSDAMGPYVDKGMLYTGDSVGTGQGNRWAIDLTTAQVGSRRYAVWSGWAKNATTDRTPQMLYIAPMENPYTISANRVLLSAPTESWEKGTELDLQEGPEFLQHGSDVFLLYSTRESWLKEYRLGQLRLQSAAADPLNAANWTKSGPVFTGNTGVFGVGHASFTTSEDNSESWIVYHSKVAEAPGWDRVVRMQKFTWSASGTPVFGDPTPTLQKVARPSGECP
ncbi:MAG: glycoside hydrolase family 43 [Gemmatimonadetes bacterium]|nr:glycoside hydrolase family 43 [Gemmatimonadota bacterium]